MLLKFRMPKATVYRSMEDGAMEGGSEVASASRKEREDCCGAGRERERDLPTESMEGFMSEIVTWTEGLWFRVCAWCSMRKAMSPVPPAMSRMRWGVGGTVEERPGLRLETK